MIAECLKLKSSIRFTQKMHNYNCNKVEEIMRGKIKLLFFLKDGSKISQAELAGVKQQQSNTNWWQNILQMTPTLLLANVCKNAI